MDVNRYNTNSLNSEDSGVPHYLLHLQALPSSIIVAEQQFTKMEKRKAIENVH
jgi:hypothetical protein